MSTSLGRALRLSIILPPLVFASGFGYWRFIRSPAFLRITEQLLSTALSAQVSIGSHELRSRSQIVLSDFSAEFLAGGGASGVSFGAKEATARAEWFLGVGPLEEVVLKDVQMRLDAPFASIAGLDVLSRPGGTASVNRVVLEGVQIAFSSGGQSYRIGGMSWAFDLAGEKVVLSASLPTLRIEGLDAPGLDAEAPRISFQVEIQGSKVAVRNLKVSGASGWRCAGDLAVNLVKGDPEVDGRLDLWNLPVRRIYTPAEGVEIPPLAQARRTIVLSGTVSDLRLGAQTAVRGLSYTDHRLGLKAAGITLDLEGVGRVDLRSAVRELLADSN